MEIIKLVENITETENIINTKTIKKTLCLNMIVKNEAHIIEYTLTNICKYTTIDYWVICDTGSDDNTTELITDFFKKKNIPGELYHNEWVGFGYNRTLALEYAFNKTDYLLVFDADDELCGELKIPDVHYDSYLLTLNNKAGFCFKRPALINNRKKWKYVGVLHEYITCLDPITTQSSIDGDCYIYFSRSGNRSKNPNKYLEDAKTLENAYYDSLKNKDNLHYRYSFYCANSYKDSAGSNDNAIKWYKNTLNLDSWHQEKYISCISLHEIYKRKNEEDTGIYYLIESYKYDNTRVEGIYRLIKYYCIKNMNDTAYSFYSLIQNYYENLYIKDNVALKLFCHIDEYEFYLPYYMIIVSERLRKYETGIKMFKIIFEKKYKNITAWWINNLIYNLQFFIDKINVNDIEFFSNCKSYFNLMHSNNNEIKIESVNKYLQLKE